MRLPRAAGILLHPTSLPVRTRLANSDRRHFASPIGWRRQVRVSGRYCHLGNNRLLAVIGGGFLIVAAILVSGVRDHAAPEAVVDP